MTFSEVSQFLADTMLDTLASLDEHGCREVVLSLVPEPVRSRLLEAKPHGWIAASDQVALYEAMFAQLGRTRAVQVCHDAMVIALRRGFLAKMADSGRRVHGQTPASILSYAPHAWAQRLTRNCGTQRITVNEARRLVLLWCDMPAVLLESEAFLAAMKAKYEAHYTALEMAGTVTIARRQPEIEWLFEW